MCGPCRWQPRRSAARQGALNKISPEISEPEGTLPEQECWWKWLECRPCLETTEVLFTRLMVKQANNTSSTTPDNSHHLQGLTKRDHPFVCKWSVWIFGSLVKKGRHLTRKQIKQVTQILSEERTSLPGNVFRKHILLFCFFIVDNS